jgi:hypothetical protein
VIGMHSLERRRLGVMVGGPPVQFRLARVKHL